MNLKKYELGNTLSQRELFDLGNCHDFLRDVQYRDMLCVANKLTIDLGNSSSLTDMLKIFSRDIDPKGKSHQQVICGLNWADANPQSWEP